MDLVLWRVEQGTLTRDELYTPCQEYFDRNKNKLHCFSDLQHYLPGLEKTALSKFVEYALKPQESENDVSFL